MRFFESQRLARRNSFYLLILFFLNVTILSGLNALIIGWLLRPQKIYLVWSKSLEGNIFIFSAAVFILITFYFILTAPRGSALAESLGGRLVAKPETDEERKLINVIEEMAIASGVPIPKVYILDHESGINAFAAGQESKSIVIAVTKGTVTQLTRDELQGVIGHEFSHILNEDMKLNMNLSGVVLAFQVFMKIGNQFTRSYHRTSRRSKSEGQAAMIGFALMVFGAVGYFLGRLIQSFISREREYLADASSAQFTRNPESLARALAKIRLGAGSEITSENTPQFAHIFFAESLNSALSFFFATHPPLNRRIQRLLPGQKIDDLNSQIFNTLQKSEGYQQHAQKEVQKNLTRSLSAKAAIETIGAPSLTNLAVSQSMLDRISTVRDLLRDQNIARACLALLTFKTQNQYLEAAPLIQKEFPSDLIYNSFNELTNQPDDRIRVTLFHFSLETLRTLSQTEKEDLLNSIKNVFATDRKTSLMEGLFYMNTELILLPGRMISEAKSINQSQKNDTQSIQSMLSNPEDINLLALKAFVVRAQNISLLEKKKLVDQLASYFSSERQSSKEEFRLLCLAIKIPVPMS